MVKKEKNNALNERKKLNNNHYVYIRKVLVPTNILSDEDSYFVFEFKIIIFFFIYRRNLAKQVGTSIEQVCEFYQKTKQRRFVRNGIGTVHGMAVDKAYAYF